LSRFLFPEETESCRKKSFVFQYLEQGKKKAESDIREKEMQIGTPIEDDIEEVGTEISDEDKETEEKEDKADNGSEVSDTQALKEAIQEQAREDERPFSSNFTLRKILGGDILTAQLIRRQIWLIVLIVFFVIVYISNRYSIQKDLLEIDRLNTQLKDAKYKALLSSSLLTEKCRESHVLEMLKSNKDSLLKMPSQPPFIITVPEE
jgi:hypothetical protein